MTQNLRQTPLTCSGHTRPVVFLSFSEFNPEDEANYYSISACKGIEKNIIFSNITISITVSNVIAVITCMLRYQNVC